MQKFTERRIGKISQAMFPYLGACSKCHTTWNYVRGHSVPFHGCIEEDRKAQYEAIFHQEAPPRHKDTFRCSGIFALCNQCWDELEPETRLPYYEELFWRNATMWPNNFTRQELELQWEEIQTTILLDEAVR